MLDVSAGTPDHVLLARCRETPDTPYQYVRVETDHPSSSERSRLTNSSASTPSQCPSDARASSSKAWLRLPGWYSVILLALNSTSFQSWRLQVASPSILTSS